ncbi:MAG: nuclear transport factor 2 family protein [Pseudomonadota bacterium]
MKKVFSAGLLFSVSCLAGCIGASAPSEERDVNRAIVETAYQSLFFDFDVESTAELLTEDYIQHNPLVPTGLQPILSVLPALKDSGLKPTVHRVISDGDLVAMHITYDGAEFFGTPTLAAFDIFRVENGLVAEHWDNLQVPPTVTVSGRSMVDGPTEITDHHLTEHNKQLVSEFINAVVIGGRFDLAGEYVVSAPGAYIQHNPTIPDGLPELGQTWAAKAAAGEGYTLTKVHMVIGEGNFVLAVSEGTEGDTPLAFYDLFRIEDGLIVEHWDVLEEIPDAMAHDNGKF